MKYATILSVSILMAVFGGAGAEAGLIAVDNPSFETLPAGGLTGVCGVDCYYSDAVFHPAPIPGWSLTLGGDQGQFHPGAANGYFNSLPFGPIVAFANLESHLWDP